jgi:hypothetical protein
MLRLHELRVPLDHTEEMLKAAILAELAIPAAQLRGYRVRRRGYDARRVGVIEFVYTLDVDVQEEAVLREHFKGHARIGPTPDETYHFPLYAPAGLTRRPVVIGTGPCGLFSGLALARMGFKPIVLERGKNVRKRTKDVWAFWRKRMLDPGSNVQFGEGGAGTFSDGKLHTRIKDRGHHGRRVLEDLVAAGAPPEILYISKPHIGTYKLVKVVENLRATILDLGGEFRFEQQVVDIDIRDGAVRGVALIDGERIESDHVILAIGHSARDTFEMLHRRGVYIEPKPFSIGFRIEHPQKLIDLCRFGHHAGHPSLGAADYQLAHHCRNGRTVYSFCMCPGGQVVAAASEIGRVVTNGMSTYSRNQENANSGLVVDITTADFGADHPLAGIALQRHWEERAFVLGGENYNAPAQLVGDFLVGRASTTLGAVKPSYLPGVTLCDLGTSLPDYAIAALREALPAFDKIIKGYAMPDAVLTGVEVRTSSPVRIRRNEAYQSVNTAGLYPAGEGAGYAGGIVSAAVDGMKVAEAVARDLARSRLA